MQIKLAARRGGAGSREGEAVGHRAESNLSHSARRNSALHLRSVSIKVHAPLSLSPSRTLARYTYAILRRGARKNRMRVCVRVLTRD